MKKPLEFRNTLLPLVYHKSNKKFERTYDIEMSRRTNRVSCTQAAIGSAAADSSLENDDHDMSNEEVPVLAGSETENSESQSRGGIFSRLRGRFFSISRQLPRSSSIESAFHSVPMNVGRNSIIIVQKKRAPFCQSIPLPPGCIPSDVMIIAENQHQASFCSQLGQMAAEIDGTKQKREENQHGSEASGENVVIAPNVQSEQYNVLPTVLHNNWVNPKS